MRPAVLCAGALALASCNEGGPYVLTDEDCFGGQRACDIARTERELTERRTSLDRIRSGQTQLRTACLTEGPMETDRTPEEGAAACREAALASMETTIVNLEARLRRLRSQN